MYKNIKEKINKYNSIRIQVVTSQKFELLLGLVKKKKKNLNENCQNI